MTGSTFAASAITEIPENDTREPQELAKLFFFDSLFMRSSNMLVVLTVVRIGETYELLL